MTYINSMEWTEEHRVNYLCYRQKLNQGNSHLVTEEERAANARFRKLERNRLNLRTLYSSYKSGAKARNIPFDLSFDDFQQLCLDTTHCPVFGWELDYSVSTGEGVGNTRANRASLDRIDNTRGYSKDNVWIISWRSNRLKYDASLDELEALVLALKEKIKCNRNNPT